MAIRGRKPKPTHLRLIQGGKKAPVPPQLLDALGPAVKPKGLTAAAAKYWNCTIARARWLTWADTDKAAMWCFLQAEFFAGGGKMLSSRIAQLRALGSELGLDPVSRARLGIGASPPRVDPLDEFLK